MIIDYSYIGNRIKAVRKQQKITQEQLAEALDVSVGYVSQIERGLTRPNLETLARISQVLECGVCYLIEGAETGNADYLIPELTEKLRCLSDTQRRLLLGIMDVIVQELDA